MKKQETRTVKTPAGRLLALLAGFVLLAGCLCGAGAEEEKDLDVAELLDLSELDESEIEEVEILPPDATLKARDREWHTPAEGSPVKCNHEVCYWTTPMGYTDEAAVWKVLTAPVTVLDDGTKNCQRKQFKIRKYPDSGCTEYTGEVTGSSQGVHVLERGEEWTLIEAYSSSTEGSSVRVWAKKFQGYVETSLLKEVEVDQTYGVVIDKQFQRLYLYKEGKLYSTMLCSTGYYNPKKKNPWNETPAGEFLCVSWTGDFSLKDDDGNANMICEDAIRINDGILIHMVPKIPKTDDAGNVNWTYDRCERYLGEKASHGCIRVQRQKTPEGVNEKWLWENLSNGTKKGQAYTKVIIWDDAGRDLDYPDDSLKLYYNPKHYASYYHSSPDCLLIKGSSKTIEITYGQLEDREYAKKKPCPACVPEPTREGIETLNAKNNR